MQIFCLNPLCAERKEKNKKKIIISCHLVSLLLLFIFILGITFGIVLAVTDRSKILLGIIASGFSALASSQLVVGKIQVVLKKWHGIKIGKILCREWKMKWKERINRYTISRPCTTQYTHFIYLRTYESFCSRNFNVFSHSFCYSICGSWEGVFSTQ